MKKFFAYFALTYFIFAIILATACLVEAIELRGNITEGSEWRVAGTIIALSSIIPLKILLLLTVKNHKGNK